MEAKFCPFCQRKNKSEAIRCAHCGVLLIAHQPGAFTTIGMSAGVSTTTFSSEQSSCADRIGPIPPDSFVLYLLDFSEPLILKNQLQLMVGRENQELEKTAVLDLSRYGDMAQGISRHHAMLRYEKGDYSIEDLGSTNGTWLNRSRLTPGKLYPLRSNDQIWLGPLKLLFCSASSDQENRVDFTLKMPTVASVPVRHMAPGFLLTTVMPYLLALEQLEHARATCLNETPKPIYVISITETAVHIQVQMEGAQRVVPLMDKWVSRWRDDHLEMVGAPGIEDKAWQEQLRPLAFRMVEFLQPTLPTTETTSLTDAFLSPLARLVTSPFEFALTT
jgi:pSer/pThr/pTyr-binding forkhead associated (FHA) protein